MAFEAGRADNGSGNRFGGVVKESAGFGRAATSSSHFVVDYRRI